MFDNIDFYSFALGVISQVFVSIIADILLFLANKFIFKKK